MIDQYSRFFSVGATASAAFTGLLLIAVSIVNQDESNYRTRERRTVLAASAFLALVDIFFVSLVSSFGGEKTFATASLAMALVGLLGTSRLLPRAIRAGNFARHFPKRNLNYAFATVSIGGYSTQVILATALLFDLRRGALTRGLVFLLVALFGSALARGWEVAGIVHRGPREGAAGAAETEAEPDSTVTMPA
jgi:hypothetical protein